MSRFFRPVCANQEQYDVHDEQKKKNTKESSHIQ